LKAACNSLSLFEMRPARFNEIEIRHEEVIGSDLKLDFRNGYEELKSLEGKIFSYALQLQSQPLQEDEARELERLQMIVRQIVFSNKNLKDIQEDLGELQFATTTAPRKLYESHQQFTRKAYEDLIDLVLDEHEPAFVQEELLGIQKLNKQHNEASNQFVHEHAQHAVADDSTSISSQLNSNREINHAVKILLKATSLWYRDNQELGH